MLYEAYQNKINRVAKVLARFVRLLPLIIAAIAMALGITATYAVMKGMVRDWTCSEQITYGEAVEFGANTFFSDVRTQYCAAETDLWQQGMPQLPGRYRVRAVTDGFFGPRYGDVTEVVIAPKEITLTVKSEELVYGNSMTPIGQTLEGHTVVCEKYLFVRESAFDNEAPKAVYSVTPDIAHVSIRNSDGEDVTAYYDIHAESALVTITKLQFTVTVPDASWVYDGESHSSEQFEMTGGGLCEGDRIEAEFRDSLTDVGSVENRPTFRVFNEKNEDVTEYYSIRHIYGKLTVEKKPVSVTVGSGEFVYRGEAIVEDSFSVDEVARPIDRHTVVADGNALSFLDVGTYRNQRAFRIVDANGTDVTSNYDLTVVEGTVTVTPRPLTVTTDSAEWLYDGFKHNRSPRYTAEGLADGHGIDVSHFTEVINVGEYTSEILFTVVDGNGKDVTSNYALTVIEGTLRIFPRPLVITTQSAEWQYDGLTHSADVYTAEGLADSHRIDILHSFEATNVGEYANEILFTIVDANGEDVMGNYAIEARYGVFRITPRAIRIETGNKTLMYNGSPQSYYGYTSEGLATGHNIRIIRMTEESDVGVYRNILDFSICDAEGTDVTFNYDVAVSFGTLTIEPRPLHITTADGLWMYDGTFHEHPVYEASGLVETHTTTPAFCTAIRHVGTAANVIEIQVNDPFGEDVTKNYAITVQEGTLEVTVRPITLQTADRTWGENIGWWVYDGMEHRNTNITVLSEIGIADGENLMLGEMPTLRDAGSVANIPLSFEIVDADHEATTDNYEITWEYGTIEVTPRPIHIKPKDVSKTYDATPLTVTDWEYVDGYRKQFIPWHTVSITVEGTRTNAGVTESSVVSVTVTDSDGTDMTANYQIFADEKGEVTVRPRTVFIKPKDASKMYDGTPLYPTEWEYTRYLEGESILLNRTEWEHLIELTAWELVNGHAMTVEYEGTITNAGQISSSIVSATVTDSTGEDVGENYAIYVSHGKLEITKRVLKIKPKYVTKPYDGLPLKATEWEYTKDNTTELLPGHQLIVIFYGGSQTEVGTSDSTILSHLIYAGGIMQNNYEVQKEPGKLTVYPADGEPPVEEPEDEGGIGGPGEGGPGEGGPGEGGPGEGGPGIGGPGEGGPGEGGPGEGGPGEGGPGEGGPGEGGPGEGGPGGGPIEIPEDLADNEFSDLRGPENELDHANIVVGRVKAQSSGAMYLRLRSFGDYYNGYWMAAPAYEELLPGGYNCNYLTSAALAANGFNPYLVEFEDMLLPLLPYYLEFADGGYVRSDNDISHADLGEDYYIRYYAPPLSLNFADLGGILGDYEAYERAYAQSVYRNYLTVDAETEAYMRALIDEQGFSLSDPDIVNRVATYIQNAAQYNLDYDKALDEEDNIIIAFLERYGEGVCRHYASAAVLLYRSLGIPARYVSGFLADTVAGEFVDITGDRAHAWVEVYIDSVGWIQVEVTGGSDFGGGSGDVGSPEDPDTEDENAIRVYPNYASKVYDGTPLYPDGNALKGNDIFSDLMERGYTYRATLSGSQIEVGQSESHIEEFRLFDPNGVDVTDSYTIIKEPGILNVKPANAKVISVYLYQLQKHYDGAPLTLSPDDYEILEIDPDVRLEMSLNSSIREVGYVTLSQLNMDVTAYITYSVTRGGVDVTDEYVLEFVELSGTDVSYLPISIDGRTVEFTAGSAEKIYDGTPLVNSSAFVSLGSLAEGHWCIVRTEGVITDVGEEENVIVSVEIFDAEGKNVTRNYNILPHKNGVLSVHAE